ncbi:MAG TPA: glycosyltransferase family 4 protein [Acidimicrobiales bacterium]
MTNREHWTRPPRVAVLWGGLSGYFHAQLSALRAAGAEVLVVHRSLDASAPFDLDELTLAIDARAWSEAPDETELEAALDDFDPDVLLVMSWDVGAYRRAARRRRGRTLRLLCMDNQWWGTAKQWGGVLISRFVLQPAYDAVFVAGGRQAEFARRLGFRAERTMWGLYVGDTPTFEKVAVDRGDQLPPEAFLYVGRLAPEKAIDVLAAAYQAYRRRVADPWPLIVSGTGPEVHRVAGLEGVELLGFVQPSQLPEVMARAGCLVLPSRFEPWGVVVHEAAAAGLPIICTWVCGASTRLVLDGYNGVVISPDDAAGLADGLARISTAGAVRRLAMGRASRQLAQQLTPDRWASYLLERVPDLRSAVGLEPTPWAAAGARQGAAQP